MFTEVKGKNNKTKPSLRVGAQATAMQSSQNKERAELARYIYWIATLSASLRARNDGLFYGYFMIGDYSVI